MACARQCRVMPVSVRAGQLFQVAQAVDLNVAKQDLKALQCSKARAPRIRPDATLAVARGANIGRMTDRSQPDYTDLSFTREGGNCQRTYRVYEFHPDNFAATCERLHRRNDDEGRDAALLRSHFALSRSSLREVPPDVPWLRAGASRERDLLALDESLVEPLRRPGLISVDFVDYANALHNGGEIRLWRTGGAIAAEAAARLVRKVAPVLPRTTHTAACCIHIRSPLHGDLKDYDHICGTIEQGLSIADDEDALIVASLMPWERTRFAISLMSVSRREGWKERPPDSDQRHAISASSTARIP